ncbi:MAG: AMP-binding protein [Pyrinomonadaceae bacterium]
MHDTNLLEDQPIAWTPTPDVIERAQLTKFIKQVGVSTWDELYEFSIRDVEKFTEEVLKFLDIEFDPPYGKLLDTSDGIEFPRWLAVRQETGAGRQESEPRAVATRSPDAESTMKAHAGLNITTMCLDRWQTDEMRDQPAVIWEGEEGEPQGISYKHLLSVVSTYAGLLRHEGFGKGDAIGIHLPMMLDTVEVLLAINRIGAIAVPVFSGYGVDAIASRMNAVRARGLVTFDGVTRRGKEINALDIARDAVKNCPSMKTVFVVGRLAQDDFDCEEMSSQPGVKYVDLHDEFLEFSSYVEDHGDWKHHQRTEPTSAEDPLIILYTSGTTGKPKGIAHTHASFPIKAAQDMAFGTDVGRGTRISWYTDIGWMMGPWLIYGALINGATICIYDGAPDYPTPDRMWEFCAKHKVEILGISPTLVRALAAHEGSRSSTTPASQSLGHPSLDKEGSSEQNSPPVLGGVAAAAADGVVTNTQAYRRPHERHDLTNLRMFASTGEPWNPAPWWWLFEKVGNSKLPIINYSGGTEISGGILMGNPLLPIKPCSFPAPCPGMDVDIVDEEGNPVGPNQVGELVIKQPWIGMARGFWQDNERYLETYWSRFKDTWVHGDWAMRDKEGHWFILGRSDDTLKVAGKRVGPAEVESLLVAHPLVTEAAVIGVPDEAKGTAMVVFCVLKDEGAMKDEGGRMKDEAERRTATSSFIPHLSSLEVELRSLVARDMGKPLAPSKIHFVSALPKTRNAKVMRRVIRAAYIGDDPGDLTALENPLAVDEIRDVGGHSRREN